MTTSYKYCTKFEKFLAWLLRQYACDAPVNFVPNLHNREWWTAHYDLTSHNQLFAIYIKESMFIPIAEIAHTEAFDKALDDEEGAMEKFQKMYAKHTKALVKWWEDDIDYNRVYDLFTRGNPNTALRESSCGTYSNDNKRSNISSVLGTIVHETDMHTVVTNAHPCLGLGTLYHLTRSPVGRCYNPTFPWCGSTPDALACQDNDDMKEFMKLMSGLNYDEPDECLYTLKYNLNKRGVPRVCHELKTTSPEDISGVYVTIEQSDFIWKSYKEEMAGVEHPPVLVNERDAPETARLLANYARSKISGGTDLNNLDYEEALGRHKAWVKTKTEINKKIKKGDLDSLALVDHEAIKPVIPKAASSSWCQQLIDEPRKSPIWTVRGNNLCWREKTLEDLKERVTDEALLEVYKKLLGGGCTITLYSYEKAVPRLRIYYVTSPFHLSFKGPFLYQMLQQGMCVRHLNSRMKYVFSGVLFYSKIRGKIYKLGLQISFDTGIDTDVLDYYQNQWLDRFPELKRSVRISRCDYVGVDPDEIIKRKKRKASASVEDILNEDNMDYLLDELEDESQPEKRRKAHEMSDSEDEC